MKKFHIIYRTTCTKTKRFYIGMHSTDDLNDGYLGSGKLLSKSIKKYGKDLHIREVLKFEKSRENLSAAEKEIVNEDLLKNKRCMNLVVGGEGGMYGQANPFFGRKHSKDAKTKISNASKGRIPSIKQRQLMSARFKNKPLAEEHRENLRASNIGKRQNHSIETINKREAAKKKSVLINNIRYSSIKEAARALGTHRNKISRFVASGQTNWKE